MDVVPHLDPSIPDDERRRSLEVQSPSDAHAAIAEQRVAIEQLGHEAPRGPVELREGVETTDDRSDHREPDPSKSPPGRSRISKHSATLSGRLYHVLPDHTLTGDTATSSLFIWTSVVHS